MQQFPVVTLILTYMRHVNPTRDSDYTHSV